jgi:diguanylate cyclase (GGDEF)-like protein
MSKRVLMIDDALPLHKLVAAHLCDLDVELHSAVDGATGLLLAARLRPDLILLDVDLPDIGGREICRRLKADPATAAVPVVFLTAASADVDRAQGLEMGAIGYLGKPFRTDQLSALVIAAIRDSHLRTQAEGLDSVTRLWTWEHLRRHLADHVADAAGAGDGPTACVAVDVDGLRLVNAQHGYLCGDHTLRWVASVLLAHCMPGACLSAAGGGRFAVVMAGIDRRAGGRWANRVRESLGDRPSEWDGKRVDVSCSFGVVDTCVGPPTTLLARAEAALRSAKENGFDRVCIARLGRRQAA